MPRIVETVEKPKSENYLGSPYMSANQKYYSELEDIETLKETFMVSLLGIGCAIVGTFVQHTISHALGVIIYVGVLPSILTIPVCTIVGLKISLKRIFFGYWELDTENDRMLKKKLF